MFIRKSHIIILFFLSIFTAYMVHLWNKSRPSGWADFASQTPQVLSSKVQKIIDTGGNVSEELRMLGSKMTETEDAQSCSQERIYFEKSLNQTAPIYREERTKNSNEFPRVCITYIMRSSFAGAEEKISPNFATCDHGSFKKGAFKPCVTDQYVNVVYNYLGDVTECLGLPQRDLLPQFYFDSGLHINAFGSSAELGVGKISRISVSSVGQDIESVIQEISNSSKSSCQRLAPYVKNLTSPLSGRDEMCSLLATPESPLTNLFYFALKFRKDRMLIQQMISQPEYDILRRLERLGWGAEQVDEEQLTQILTALSSHSGAKTAVKMLSKYLQVIEASGRQLQPSDFDFSVINQNETQAEMMSFAQYLRLYQDNGIQDYLYYLQQAARELNAVFKEGVCAPDSYLKL